MEMAFTAQTGVNNAMSSLPASFTGNGALENTADGEAPPTTALDIHQQRKDIDRIMAKFEGLQKDVDSMKTTLEDIKKATQKSSQHFDSNTFAKELELLTESVSHIGSKANEIDGLKLELEMMKRRITCLEETNADTQSTHTVTGLTPNSSAALQSWEKTGPLARRSRKLEDTSSNRLLPVKLPPESVGSLSDSAGFTEERPRRSLSRDTAAGQQVIDDSAHLCPTLSGEGGIRAHHVQREDQDILRDAQLLPSQLHDVTALPQDSVQPSRSATIEESPQSQAAPIEELGPGQTHDRSYQPSYDVDIDMDESVDVTQITASGIRSYLEGQGSPSEARRSTMSNLPFHSLPQQSPSLYSTSASSNDGSDLMGESFHPSGTLASDQNPDPSLPEQPKPRTPNQIARTPIEPVATTSPIHPTLATLPSISDPEDSDFAPHRTRGTATQRSGGRGRRRRRGGRTRKSTPLRNVTPEWEKPDWEGPDSASPYYAYGDNKRGLITTPTIRGRKVIRRGVSGGVGEPAAKRAKGGEEDKEEGEIEDGRARDEEGYLLLPSEKRDGRSLRAKKWVGVGRSNGEVSHTGEKVDYHEKIMRQIFPARRRNMSRESGVRD